MSIGKDVLTWDSLKQLHKLNTHLSYAATEIEELGPNIIDYAFLSERLKVLTGIHLRELRDICDIMAKIEKEEYQKAKEWEEYLSGN